MKAKIALFYLLMASALAGAGTSVGNFHFKTQFDFDFRIGYPPDWNWQSVTPQPGETERWVLDNSRKATTPAQVSSGVFSFLAGFPATNDQELLAEITRRHPGVKWMPIQNPDFSVGYVSDQTYLSPNRTLSYEYVFSSKNKVIKIEATRDADARGATELDDILSAIRRPSGLPRVLSIKAQTATPVKPGDEFCYAIEVDSLKSDFDSNSLSDFNVEGAFRHYSFKTITWDRPSSSLIVCVPVNEHFTKKGLNISEFTLSGGNNTAMFCSDMSTGTTSSLYCNGQTIVYTVPTVENAKPANSAPVFRNVSVNENVIHVDVSGALPLTGAEIKLAFSKQMSTNESQLVYEDEIGASGFTVTYEEERLPPGFTRVLEISVIDQVGNAGRLKALEGKTTYTYFSSSADPQETKIPVVSLKGVAP